MSTPLPPEDERLMARLTKHPQLRGPVERLVDIVEDMGMTCAKPTRRSAV